jgi:AraC-like DNA-binding protein
MEAYLKNMSDSLIQIETKTTGFLVDPVEMLGRSLEFTFYEGRETHRVFAHTTGWRILPFSVFSCLLSNTTCMDEVEGRPLARRSIGQAIIIPTGVRHKGDILHPRGVRALWMHFRFRLLGGLDLFSLVEPPSVLTAEVSATGCDILRELLRLYATEDVEPLMLMARRRSAVCRFLTFLLDVCPPKPQYARMVCLSQKLASTLDFIQKHYAEPVTCDQLARYAHLSRSHFHALFRRLTGRAPLDYVKHHRLQVAQVLLLTTGQTIGSIAAAVGYQDPFHFSRLFKATVGVSPRRYRASI